MSLRGQKMLVQRMKLLRQNLYARLGHGDHVRVRVSKNSIGWAIQTDTRTIIVPSLMRWKIYKHGWKNRLDRLEKEYGVGRFVKLTDRSLVLDIGANTGEFAHVCNRYGATVHCFEPDPIVYDCLRQNIFDVAKAIPHEEVTWSHDGEVEFFSAPDHADSSAFLPPDGGLKFMRPAITIETFCIKNGISQVDLVKCDAEGAEPEVLLGIGAFAKNIGVVALDTGAERLGERTNVQCGEILASMGFEVLDVTVGNRQMTFGLNPKFKPVLD